MLRPELSVKDISAAEQRCWKWRKTMLDLFEKSKIATPNFHAILHVFPQALMYGPPVLYWARPFEHKHSTYRGYIENSNNINVETFCMLKEKYVDALHYVLPCLNIRAPKPRVKRKVNVNDYITFSSDDKKHFGKVTKVLESGYEMLVYGVKPGITKKMRP